MVKNNSHLDETSSSQQYTQEPYIIQPKIHEPALMLQKIGTIAFLPRWAT